MTVHLKDRAGAALHFALGARQPFVVGVATTDDVVTTLRRAVHADLVRRAAERHHAVVAIVAVGRVSPEIASMLPTYNCRPFGEGEPDVVVGVEVFPPYDAATADLAADPLAVRLALLGHHDHAGAAGDELARWRAVVTSWSESPSKPMCADYVGWCHDAIDDNLDTPRLLHLMREVETHPELPPGSKFETFAHLDTLVGLDLARDVGLTR